ncbi:MAG: NADH-quinone oxidoreductase subunit NuoH [Isosphaeraceae bacterium]
MPVALVAWPCPLWAQSAAFDRAEPFAIPWIAWVTWIAVFLGIFPLIVAYTVWGERKVAARFQDRVGPNRVGPLGLLQSIADLLKLLIKEDLVPSAADRWVHLLAPILLLTSSMLGLAVIPFGVSGTSKVAPFGMERPDPAHTEGWLFPGLSAVDIPSGLLYVVAASSISSLGIFLAGWGSRNKYSLLGAMRGVAQLVSYEIPQVLALVPVILWTGSLSLTAVFNRQLETGWFAASPPGFLAFLIFLIASLAEVNRTPFDIPEAESEIIAGYHTEYSGMRFGLFFLAEYLGMVIISSLATLLFLGGGQLPFTRFPLGDTPLPTFWANMILVPVFAIKAMGFLFLMFWIRATLPRMRVDRLMAFAWKFLIPLSLANIVLSAIWYECVHRTGTASYAMGWAVTLPLAMVSAWGAGRLYGAGPASIGAAARPLGASLP